MVCRSSTVTASAVFSKPNTAARRKYCVKSAAVVPLGTRRFLAHRFLFSAVLLGSLVTAAAHPAGQSLTSALTYPVNGATNADLSLPIRWTTVTGAQAYQLYIGSTVGASNILNSRQTQATSFL